MFYFSLLGCCKEMIERMIKLINGDVLNSTTSSLGILEVNQWYDYLSRKKLRPPKCILKIVDLYDIFNIYFFFLNSIFFLPTKNFW